MKAGTLLAVISEFGVALSVSLPPVVLGQCLDGAWFGGVYRDGLGYSVCADGHRVVIPAYAAGGIAHVFERSGRNWITLARLLPEPNLPAYNGFPGQVGIEGDRIVATAPYDHSAGRESGAVYVFEFDGVGWYRSAKLVANDAHEYLRLGWSVAVSADTIVAGSIYDLGYAGSAYVFRFDGIQWFQEAKLFAADAINDAQFGVSVAIDGDIIVVGANWDGLSPWSHGSAYVFERDASGAWTQTAKLTPPNPATLGSFGATVAVRGTTILTGQLGADVTYTDSGEAYVYDRMPDGQWALTARLRPNDAHASQAFGWTVAFNGDLALIGAPADSWLGIGFGTVYVFQRDAPSTWRQVAKIWQPYGGDNNHFGSALALSANTAVIGAWETDANGIDSGAAYAYAVSRDLNGNGAMDVCECLGDLNADRAIDELDLGLLLQAWNSTAGGDLNADGDTDEADLGLMLANWALVCP
ncbi:MAG: hypothetical protein U1D55_04580 [Phycisphaerae bacterium]